MTSSYGKNSKTWPNEYVLDPYFESTNAECFGATRCRRMTFRSIILSQFTAVIYQIMNGISVCWKDQLRQFCQFFKQCFRFVKVSVQNKRKYYENLDFSVKTTLLAICSAAHTKNRS